MTENNLTTISVIIPTLDEEANIASAVASARSCPQPQIIVADGGSTDGTTDLARSLGVETLDSPRGRARQMNLAASRAWGDILLFLHADTRLPEAWADLVREELARPGTACGAFRLCIDTRYRGARIVEILANFRSSVLQMPYGDQAIFVKKRIFDAVGGFPDLPIMEDFEFIRRVRSLGRVGISPAPVTTSGRRWEEIGFVKTTLINQLVILLFFLGVSSDRIARLYRSKQGIP